MATLLHGSPQDNKEGTIRSNPAKGGGVLLYHFKAFTERAATERNSVFKGGLGALLSTSAWGYVDSHMHCLPVVSEQKSKHTENET